MAILLHGTTRLRAIRIAANGPDPDFIEPGGGLRAENFSVYFENGPFLVGSPEEYACNKAALFPAEGGAVILVIDVPDDIVSLAINALFPRAQGIVQFNEFESLEELRRAWSPQWCKEIRSVQCP
jgi:hypothetical protein